MRGRYGSTMRRRRAAPDRISAAPATPIRPAGAPVRGSSWAGAACVEAGAAVAAGALVAAGVVEGVAVVVCVCVCVFAGVLGAVSGSWYCSSPAPCAKALAGLSASSAEAAMVVRARRRIAPSGSRRIARRDGYAACVAQRRRVALIHDFLLDLRGAERVFLALCDIYPDAPIYTPVYDEHGTEGRFAHRGVNASFLQRLRPTARTFRALLPLYPAAIESFDLPDYDLVVPSSSAWAHAVICDVDTVHVSYCHNPFRYAWNDRDRTLAE